jgi:hypothetical protein
MFFQNFTNMLFRLALCCGAQANPSLMDSVSGFQLSFISTVSGSGGGKSRDKKGTARLNGLYILCQYT